MSRKRKSGNENPVTVSAPQPVAPRPAAPVVNKVPRVPREKTGTSRSTLNVGRSLQKLADALPDTVYQRSRNNLSQRARVSTDTPAPTVQAALSKRPVRQDMGQPGQLKLQKDRPHCKKRPESNVGGGGSRPFIPWCNKS